MGWMELYTFEEIYNNKILGLAWGNCITNYYANFTSDAKDIDYKTMLEYSMFADPTVAIQDGDDPVNIPEIRPVVHRLLERILNYFPNLTRLIELIISKII